MKHILSVTWLLLLLTGKEAFSQSKTEVYQDSVFRCFVTEKAHQVPLHSRVRERYLDSALRLLPRNAYLWQQRAMPLFKIRQYEAGMPFLDSAVKYDPARYLPYRAFMKCIFQKSYRAALSDFDAATQLSGNGGVMDHSYDFFRALCYLQLRDFDTAEALMQSVIRNTEKTKGLKWVHYNDWFYLGVIRFEKEDVPGAVACFERCLAAFPNYPDATYFRGVCDLQLGRYEAAARLFLKAQKDFEAGWASTEDNAIYEPYPYTVSLGKLKIKAAWAKTFLHPEGAATLSNSGE